MADLRIRAIFDATNTAQGLSTLARKAKATSVELLALGRINLTQQLAALPKLASVGGIGSVRALVNEYGALTASIKEVGEASVAIRPGQNLPLAEFVNQSANIDKTITSLKNYFQATSDLKTAHSQYATELTDINRLYDQQITLLSSPRLASIQRIEALRGRLPALNDEISSARSLVAPRPFLDTATQHYDRERLLNPLLQDRARIYGAIGAETQKLNILEDQYGRSVKEASKALAAQKSTLTQKFAPQLNTIPVQPDYRRALVGTEPGFLAESQGKTRVTFDSLQQGQAFFAGIKNSALETVAAVNRAGEILARTRFNIPRPPTNQEGTFLDIRQLRTEVDTAGNILKQYAQIGYTTNTAFKNALGEIQVVPTNFVPLTDEIQINQGNVDQIVAASKEIGAALENLNVIKERTAARKINLADQITGREAAIRETFATPQANISSRISQIDAEIAAQQISATKGTGIVQQGALERILVLEQERNTLQGQLAASQTKLTAALAEDVKLIELRNQLTAASVAETNGVAAAEERVIAARNKNLLPAASGLVSTPPQNYAQISPQLKRALEKQGLASTIEGLAAQQAQFSAPKYNLERGTTSLGGTFIKDVGTAKEVTAEWGAQIDNTGKVITRFGGQLSGASHTLQQISRDFQKVIEWTVATTIVFGALQYTISQLRNLSELDKALQKFAITAQQSPQQAQQSFGKLAEIAYNTATPLLEIINAADDIALATQKAGQSTEAWNHQISSLTESVGVFTNLTGIDTVQATDILTATMKQLRITAEGIPAILSKITAVAGGQSAAIADITKGLSAMAEAGRVANLTVDQQIATIQVLSQVTSKTPSEVATAFKNLVGALSLPLAAKGLEKFDIQLRDSAGNLRNILDVYGEISDKIKSGVIPAGDVQGLLRAISGGRTSRQADVAALLGSIDQIIVAQRKAEGATNEAAIANAKSIDTIQAKFIQLQTTIDAVTFEKFGREFKNFIGSFITLLTTVLKGFNAIPTGVTAAAIQLGLFFLAVRGGTRLLIGLKGLLGDVAGSFLQVAAAEGVASQASLRGPTGLLARTKTTLGATGVLGKVGAGAAVGAGLSALTGGTPGQILGGGLQGLGFGLLTIPEPTGLTKVAGILSLVVGTLLQFTTASKDAAESQTELAARVLDAYDKYRSAATTVNDLTDAQAKLTQGIDTISAKTNKSAADFAQLDGNQKEYTKNLISLIDAQNQLIDARTELLGTLPPEQAALFASAQAYQGNKAAIDEAIKSYQKLILQRAGIAVPDVSIPIPKLIAPAPYDTGNSFARRSVAGNAGVVPLFDLNQLATDASKVTELFDETGTHIREGLSFDISGRNIALITSAINKLKDTQPDLAAKLLSTANAFFAQNDAISQLNSNLAAYQAYIDAVSVFNPAAGAEGQKAENVATFARSLFKFTPESSANLSPDRQDQIRSIFKTPDQAYVDVQKLVSNTLTSGTFDYKQFGVVATEAYSKLTEEQKANIPYSQFLINLAEKFNLDLSKLGLTAQQAFSVVTDEAKAAGEALETAGAQLQQGVIDRITKVQTDFQAGTISEAVRDKSIRELQKYLSDIQGTTSKFSSSLQLDPQFGETLKEVQPLFSNIIGLENAASLTSDEFIKTLLTLGDTYGLNGKQLVDLQLKLIDFYNLVQDLNKLRAIIGLEVQLDTKSLKAQIDKVLKALIASGAFGNIFTAANNPLFRQLFALQQALKDIGSLQTDNAAINKLYKSGSGANIGAYPSSGAGTGKDISELDLPESIAKSINESSLIQQAIANAKKLQSQIPGATKDAKNDLVILLDGMNKILTVHGVKSEYLSRALNALADIEQKRLDFETKADVIRRIRVGAGDFSAIANVPVNSTTGVSLGGAQGPINITLNLNGTVLTPAQLAQFADLVAAALKKQIAGG